jgi:hypothetical protein
MDLCKRCLGIDRDLEPPSFRPPIRTLLAECLNVFEVGSNPCSVYCVGCKHTKKERRTTKYSGLLTEKKAKRFRKGSK